MYMYVFLYGRPMEQGKPLYFHPVISSFCLLSIFLLFLAYSQPSHIECLLGSKSPRKWIYSVPAQEMGKHRAKFGWPTVSDVGAVITPRRDTRWDLPGCPKLTNRYQPLVGRSSPYYEDMWRRYCCLSLFPIVDTCLSCEGTARQSCAMVRRWRIFGDFLRPAFLHSVALVCI